ncbi:hypothetical protein [Myxococcus stipitatus]|uniref:hypothetical protein n=1 Tax=Myxococcus stipitatus TaxID=83455 RepID=UPI001F31C565|nr:hypothetical protein [Myxococcus stipitatus]
MTTPGYHDFHRQSLGARARAPGKGVPVDVRMGLTGGPLGGGVGLDGVFSLEVGQLGLGAKVTGLDLPAEDGSGDSDQITLTQLHATFAAVAIDRLRLRAEAGVSLARAPDISFTGLSLGTSMEVCLGGPFDLEARVQVTPFPYRQLDALAGLAVNVRPLEVRAGYRVLVLDDQGLVDGVQHVDRFRGPYFGLGLGF